MDNELIVVKDGICILSEETSYALAEFERIAKEVKQEEDELKAKILEEMQAKGIVKIDTPDIAITYIEPTNRETFDGKKFRCDYPDLYDDYITITPVKASVRLKVK